MKERIDINDLTLGQAKELANYFNAVSKPQEKINNKMIGQYVIVRCKDAGVHAGYLESYNGRECVITESRRLWYWKPAGENKFLSGVASDGLHADSKIGVTNIRIHLTENCEITQCSDKAAISIQEIIPDGM